MNTVLGEQSISEEERALFESVSSDTPAGPKKVIISPTDWCNLQCETCWRLEKDVNPNSYRKDELSFDEISRILHDCAELGVREIDLTGGGEPFSRKDMLRIITLAKKLGFWVTLTTNGTLLDENTLEKLVKIGLDDITFSFDGSSARLNDSIRGKGVFEKTRSALAMLNHIKLKREAYEPVIRLAFVITARNYHDVPDIVRFAVLSGASAIQFSTLLEWGSNQHLSMSKAMSGSKGFMGLLSRKPEPFTLLKEGARLAEQHDIYTNLASIMNHGFSEHKMPDFCFAPWELLFINSRGSALACCVLASFFENELGNVRDTPLKELWHSEKMKAFRRKLNDGKFFNGCERCLPDFVDRFDSLEGRRKLCRGGETR